jgi:quinol monooxygenase YgiN
MAEPIAFISHFRIKPGKLQDVRAAASAAAAQLAAAKPRTAAFLASLDENGQRLSFVHLFPDAAAMDLHIEGAADRSQAAYELFEPAGWEIYGTPSAAAREMIERDAADAGVPLIVEPDSLGGFLRPES